MCAAALCPVRGGIRQERYPSAVTPVHYFELWDVVRDWTFHHFGPFCMPLLCGGELTAACVGSVFGGHRWF